MLIGPSGCGKTTTMRIINRMIEPDCGTRHGGRPRHDADVDPVSLRRSIGYVIQQIGLFPHWSIADNIATVPRLLELGRGAHRARASTSCWHWSAWSRRCIATAFPRELSGGQKPARRRRARARGRPAGDADGRAVRRHRPDHARAAAGRVPAASCAGLKKTIVFVTHDIDEALKMGDRIAILRDGALVQYDTPEAILAQPADAFVEAFVGTDRALKRLALIRADTAMEPRGSRSSLSRHRCASRACARRSR